MGSLLRRLSIKRSFSPQILSTAQHSLPSFHIPHQSPTLALDSHLITIDTSANMKLLTNLHSTKSHVCVIEQGFPLVLLHQRPTNHQSNLYPLASATILHCHWAKCYETCFRRWVVSRGALVLPVVSAYMCRSRIYGWRPDCTVVAVE